MAPADERARALLRLVLVPGLGPARISRLIDAFGSPDAVLGAPATRLARVRGIGPALSESIAAGLSGDGREAEEELERLHALGGRLVGVGEAGYPSLLASMPTAPQVLFVRGGLEPGGADRYTVSIVGSRACTSYGIEQGERFGRELAAAGLSVVSGGARGIDSAAHRGALKGGGRTVVVLGCGLGCVYPPENAKLFDAIVDHGGSIVSELPCGRPPEAGNFPARNRVIAGMSLGVVVVEAARGSGALITANHAVELGREVMALPGRVDSVASEGSNGLLQRSEAALVTRPGDVLDALETDARYLHQGVHDAATRDPRARSVGETSADIGDAQGLGALILGMLDEPKLVDDLATALACPADVVRAEITMLEISGRVLREGLRVRRRKP